MNSQYETLELWVDAPYSLRAEKLNDLLGAMDRVYSLAVLIQKARYRARLRDHLQASDPGPLLDGGNHHQGRATSGVNPRARIKDLDQLVDIGDRLKLNGSLDGPAERITLTGHADSIAVLRHSLDRLMESSPSTNGNGLITELAAPLRREALLLNLGPWDRGRLIVCLHRALGELASASSVLIPSEIRVLEAGQLWLDEEKRAA